MEKPRILLVDDEERILRSLGLLLRMQYQVFATSDGHEALAILRREKIHVLISDQRMPIMSGTELLRRAREIAPDTVRLLLTGYADADAALGALNDGEIFRYINKPWGPKELRDTIAQAVDVALALDQAPVPQATVAASRESRLTCLVLDRDEATFQAVQGILGQEHDVIWSRTVATALATLASRPVAILVTELSLGDEDMSAMVKTLKQEHPELLTIILTCFKDTARLVELINQAQVFRYLPKPLRRGLLSKSIESSIIRYRSLRQQPARLASQAVEKPQAPAQQEAGSRIAEHLARLRSKALFARDSLA